MGGDEEGLRLNSAYISGSLETDQNDSLQGMWQWSVDDILRCPQGINRKTDWSNFTGNTKQTWLFRLCTVMSCVSHFGLMTLAAALTGVCTWHNDSHDSHGLISSWWELVVFWMDLHNNKLKIKSKLVLGYHDNLRISCQAPTQYQVEMEISVYWFFCRSEYQVVKSQVPKGKGELSIFKSELYKNSDVIERGFSISCMQNTQLESHFQEADMSSWTHKQHQEKGYLH